MLFTIGVIFLAGILGFFLRSEYEREQLSEEHIALESSKLEADYKLLFLSDLHDHEFGKENKKLIQAIDRIDPDLILVGGDMIVSQTGGDTTISLKLLKNLSSRYPVMCGNGNHENKMKWYPKLYKDQYFIYTEALKDMGIKVLDNKTEAFGNDLAVTGIDLDHLYYKKFRKEELRKEEMEKRVGKADKKRYQILLCHSPLYFQECSKWGADLTLSGHFHGGTIRLPLFGGVMTPQIQFFNPYCGGTFAKAGRHMIVSRGLGTHSIHIRFHNKPQLVVVDLKRKT